MGEHLTDGVWESLRAVACTSSARTVLEDARFFDADWIAGILADSPADARAASAGGDVYSEASDDDLPCLEDGDLVEALVRRHAAAAFIRPLRHGASDEPDRPCKAMRAAEPDGQAACEREETSASVPALGRPASGPDRRPAPLDAAEAWVAAVVPREA